MDQDVRDNPLFGSSQTHFHDMIRPSLGGLRSIEELAVSLDGETFAIGYSTFARLSGWPQRRLGVINGRDARIELVPSSNNELHPRFSPDGARLAFLSDRVRAGQFQVHIRYLHDLTTVLAAPAVDGTVEAFEWSPDGHSLLILAAGLKSDRASAMGSGSLIRENEPSSWNPGFDERGGAQTWRSLWIWDISARAAQRITSPGTNVWEAAWCGGRDRIIAITTERAHEGAWYSAKLQGIAADGTKSVTYDIPSGDQLGAPVSSMSGRYVAVISTVCSDRMMVAGDVLLLDTVRNSRQMLDLAGLQVTQTAWRRDTTLFCIGFLGFATIALEYDTTTGEHQELWRSHDNCCGGAGGYPRAMLTPNGGFATLIETYKRPATPVVIQDGEIRVLHEICDAGVDSIVASNGTLEETTWKGRDGLEIQGYVAKPETAGPHPLVVLVHGGPVFAFRNSWSMSYIFTPLLVRHGYAVFHPNPRGSAGRSRYFSELVRGDLGGEDAFDIIRGVESLIDRGLADPKRLATMGRSYGGYMSAWMTAICDLFSASIPMNCALDWYSRHFTSNAPEFQQLFLPNSPLDVNGLYFDRSVVMRAQQIKTPTLLIVGAADLGSPPTQGLMLHRALMETGTTSCYVTYPEEGHHITRLEAQIDLCARCLIWLARFV